MWTKILFISFTLILSTCRMTVSGSIIYPEDTETKPVITGKFTWSEWQEKCGWGDCSVPDYEPTDNLLDNLKSSAESLGIRFVLVSASWCGDSKSEVPKIFKLFAAAGLPESLIELWGVDREKIEPSAETEKYSIERVPTLIIFKNGEELGRIIEYPEKTWEEDILEICLKGAIR